MTDSTSAIATAKAAIASVEAKLVADTKSVVANPRWTSSRLWVLLGALVAIVLLHHYGLDKEILAIVFQLVVLFLVTRTLTDLSRDAWQALLDIATKRCDADVEIARISKGFDDGNPLLKDSAKTPIPGTLSPAPGTPVGGTGQ